MICSKRFQSYRLHNFLSEWPLVSSTMQKVGMECLDRMPFLSPAPVNFDHVGSRGRNSRCRDAVRSDPTHHKFITQLEMYECELVQEN